MAEAPTPFFKLIEDGGERYVYGPASVEILDKQGDIITGPPLRKALPQLLLRARFSLNHQDILPGAILPSFKVGDRVYKTEVRPITESDLSEFPKMVEAGVKVGDESLFTAGHIYKDTPFCDMVWQKMQTGELNCLSISGQAIAKSRKQVCSDFVCKFVNVITDIALSAVTFCKTGANPGAHVKPILKSDTGGQVVPQYIILKAAWASEVDMGEVDKILGQMDSMVRKGLDTDGEIAKTAAHLRKYVNDLVFKPMGAYADFAACVAANKEKGDPDAYCGSIKHKVEDAKKEDMAPAAMEGPGGLASKDGSNPIAAHAAQQAQAKTVGGATGAMPFPKMPKLPKPPIQGGYVPTQKAMDIALRSLEAESKISHLEKYGPVAEPSIDYSRITPEKAREVLGRGAQNPDKLGESHEAHYRAALESYKPPAPTLSEQNRIPKQKPHGQGMAEAAKNRGIEAAKAAVAEGKSPTAALAAARAAQAPSKKKDDLSKALDDLEKADRVPAGNKGNITDPMYNPFSGRKLGRRRGTPSVPATDSEAATDYEPVNTKVSYPGRDAWQEFQRLNRDDADAKPKLSRQTNLTSHLPAKLNYDANAKRQMQDSRYPASKDEEELYKALDELEAYFDGDLSKRWRPRPYKDSSGVQRIGAENEKGVRLYGSDAMHALGQQNNPEGSEEGSAAPPSLEQRVRALEMAVRGMGNSEAGSGEMNQ